MIEAIALGDGARKLLLIEDPGLDDVALEGLLRLLGRLDGDVHDLTFGQAELDDYVVEEDPATIGIGRRGDPRSPRLEAGDALASLRGGKLGHSGADCGARSVSAAACSARLSASAGVEVSPSGWIP